MRKFIAIAALLFPLVASAQDPGRIAAHMRFLASDLLEGRGTGTRGYMIAAQYIASEYEKLGLEPGANGGYFQARMPHRAPSGAKAISSATCSDVTDAVL